MQKSNKLLREYLRAVIESAPSKLNIKQNTLSADSSAHPETSHLDKIPEFGDEDEELKLSPHLQYAEENEELTVPDFGPVPPTAGGPHCFPDPFIRGEYDNVTWNR